MLQHLPANPEQRWRPSSFSVQAEMALVQQYLDQERRGCHSTIDLGRSSSDFHILVIHHQPETLSMISSMIRKAGYGNITMESSAKEINNIKHKPCDLLFTELEMPDLDGHSLACLYKNHHPQAKAVVMTCRCQAEIIDLIRGGIVDGWLHKPFDIEALSNMLMGLWQDCEEIDG